MRVLIHTLAASAYGGSDRFMRGLIPALGRQLPQYHFVIAVNSSYDLPVIPDNVTLLKVQIRSQIERAWWDQFVMPKLLQQQGVDCIWATLGFSTFLPPVPQVLFQRNSKYYCDYYLRTLQGWSWISTLTRRKVLWLLMRTASRIVVPTASMRQMIRTKHHDIPAEGFVVIPHAFDLSEAEGDRSEKAKRPIQGHPSKEFRFLYVGHILPYKGVFDILELLDRFRRQVTNSFKCFLTIARDDWPVGFDRFVAQVRHLGLDNQIVILGKVPADEMWTLYRSCDVLLYPSLCESYGFPLVEALRCGLPVIAVDTPVNRELAGYAARYYKPGDVTAAVEALTNILLDRAYWHHLAELGRQRWQEVTISWDEYARRCIALSQVIVGVGT